MNLRLRYGLNWHKPTWRIVAGWILNLLGWLAIVVATVTLAYYVQWLREGFEQQHHEARKATAAMQKYERVIITCLNHGVIKVDGELRICEA